MQAAATAWVLERVRPVVMAWSVRVGWRREWSSILARRGRETVVLRGGIVGGVGVGGGGDAGSGCGSGVG